MLQGEKVNLIDMLNCRERRNSLQNQLISKHQQPLLSFCMNIPGEVKTNEAIKRAFDLGQIDILKALINQRMRVLEIVEVNEKTGDELLLSVAADACELKELAMNIEETHRFGRLFDIDILNASGVKLSRSNYRTCFVCDEQAQVCGRNRTHKLEDVLKVIVAILEDNT